MHRAAALYARAAGPNADTALIARHGPLLDRLARKLALRTGASAHLDDLWSAGALGLLDAARRYDDAREVPFERYVEHRIRGAMLDELRRLDHLPRRLRARTEELGKTRHRLSRLHGREATMEELAAELSCDASEVAELDGLSAPLVPLLPELPVRSEDLPADERLFAAELREGVAAAIGALPERLQLVLSLRYVEELSNREIAGLLKVSEPRVCQLHGEAIGKLRTLLGDG